MGLGDVNKHSLTPSYVPAQFVSDFLNHVYIQRATRLAFEIGLVLIFEFFEGLGF